MSTRLIQKSNKPLSSAPVWPKEKRLQQLRSPQCPTYVIKTFEDIFTQRGVRQTAFMPFRMSSIFLDRKLQQNFRYRKNWFF